MNISRQLTKSFVFALLLVVAVLSSENTFAQSTTSSSGTWADGDGTIWSSGSAPGTGWTTINIGHTVTRESGWTVRGTMNVNSSADLTLKGNVVVDGGSTLNVYGTLKITGSVTLNSGMNVFPGGTVIVNGNVTVVSSLNLTIGDGTATGAPYGDMIVKGDLFCQGGKVAVKSNGRLGVFEDLTSNTWGGVVFTIDNGGKVFVNGNLEFPGGGDTVDNNNTGGNIGLYVDGVVDVDSGNVGSEEEEGGYASSEYLKDSEGGGDDDFYTWIASAEDSPLPVELLSFDVQNYSTNVILTWVTASETDNHFFTIEKSYDGENFSVVAEILGQGTTTQRISYTWEDMSAASTLTYYRLSQTDFDGTTEILALKTLNAKGLVNSFSFYPNPVSSERMIRFEGAIPESLTIINQSGQIVLEGKVFSGTIQLPQQLPAGLYILQGVLDGQHISQRLFLK